MNIINIIEKKRDGHALSKAEIDFFISGYCEEQIPDYQASALLMAIFIRGLSDQELFDLTDAMIRSGKVLDFSALDGIFVDKHSTGGVGDKTSLVLGPLLAACGLKVAKMSGRGLSFTGGTIDKLEAIPGYQVAISESDFLHQVDQIGVSIIGQSKGMVYADQKLYALRDVTGTVDCIPLIASSIMSKKIAAGSDIILLDVKYGDGAFMSNAEDAIQLADTMIAIGKHFNKIVRAEITSMNDVLGTMIGNSLEVKEAIDTLKGQYDQDFYDLCVHSASVLLIEAKIVDNEEDAHKLIEAKIKDGSALEKLKEMIAHQHGDASVVEQEDKMSISKNKLTIFAEEDGYINQVQVKQLGIHACALGAGRFKLTDEIDHSVGIEVHKKTGDAVHVGDALCTLYYNKIPSDSFQKEVERCFVIEKIRKEPAPLIYAVR